MGRIDDKFYVAAIGATCVIVASAISGHALATPASPRGVAAPGAGFEVESYALTLAPDLASRTVSGTQTIMVRSLESGLRTVAFSPNALTVVGASVDERPMAVRSDGKAIAFELPRPIAKGGSATLRFSYHGTPARGVVWGKTSVYTSYFACDWMVCLQDTPGDKARFALDLAVPADMTSLSVGALAGKRRTGSGAVVHRWRPNRQYSPYLYGFAAGRFNRATDRGPGGELAFLSDVAAAPELTRRFAETRPMVAFLSGKAGLGLPAGRYTQLLVAGREAQEAATYSVIGASELDQSAGAPEKDWAIVHELAHQWWGNLVTCATWRDFWLNEGIAVFMTAAWKEHRFGPAAYRAELDIARTRLARARDAGWDKPLAFDGAYPSIGTRRAIQYSKGALFMDHLRTTLGDVAFWDGLKRFTRRHAGGTVTSIDLQRAMEKASGRDLSGTFAEWVYGAPPAR